MNIQKIHIINFKNHKSLKLDFHKNIVCIVGKNGIGKTNILDAIHFSCMGKSYFSSSDKNCTHYDESFFRLETSFYNFESEDVKEKSLVITYEKSKRKNIILDDLKMKKLSDYLGNFPVVVIAPDDNIILLGGSEERRKIIDQTIIQTDKEYFINLIEYNKILSQRNALLKKAYDSFLDINLLEIYNEKLIPLAEKIYAKRKKFIEELLPFFNKAYTYISEEKEVFEIKYLSKLQEYSYRNLLEKSFEKDKILKRTTTGIHRDDLEFFMNDVKIKTFGSQGQQKTFLLALKLAQHDYLQKKLSKSVFFLIDDIFDKIDSERSKNLISFVSQHIGQVFVSYTNKNILESKFKNIDYQLIEL